MRLNMAVHKYFDMKASDTLKDLIIISLLICNIQDSTAQQRSLHSIIGYRGVRGVVHIEPNFRPNQSLAVLTFPNIRNSHLVEIRENRVLTDVTVRCLDRDLGRRYINSTWLLVPGRDHRYFSLTSDARSLNGRAILLTNADTGERVCGTLEPRGLHNTAEAKFLSNIGGIVTFRQLENDSLAETSVRVSLFKLQEENPVAETFFWFLVPNPNRDQYKTTMNTECRLPLPFPPSLQQLYSMSRRFGRLLVGANKNDATFTFIDSELPLSGLRTVIGNILVLAKRTGEIASCALIREIEPKQAIASVFNDGVKGTIQFFQRSSYDNTVVQITLNNLRGLAGGYHIHKWPVPVKLTALDNVCDDKSISGHYDFQREKPTSPSRQTGTSDQYEIGDLSGKYGYLTGQDSFNGQFKDDNLPLFGKYSVIGRSFTIHRSYRDERWVCATIKPISRVTKAVAKFVGPVIGQIVFMQNRNDYYSDTHVFVEVSYSNGIRRPTFNHNWHVHENSVCNLFNERPCNCSAAGEHFNPYRVNINGNYGTECRFCNPLRCELGDLSGKKEAINVRGNNTIWYRNYFTDMNLPLEGPLGIIGKSVVIHDENKGKGRLACANIFEVPARALLVENWYGSRSAPITGLFEFVGNVPQYEDAIAWTSLRLSGLQSRAAGYHIHTEPVDLSSPTPCENNVVGGHFNPFFINQTKSPPPGTGTHDLYEVGDLSGKYGSILEGRDTALASGPDNFLPVSGPLSISGRSLVIHRGDGSRWLCGNIEENTEMSGGRIVRLIARFTRGLLSGSIVLKQYIYPDNTASDTEILVDLKFRNNERLRVRGLNWHVHVYRVVEGGNCQDAGPHFNPYNVNTTVGYEECSFSNPYRCELGDTSGKHGVYEIGGGPRFYTDANLPLIGRFGVANRSFVIHQPVSQSGRFDCANIVPFYA
ncbi:uncharacterized protein LOC133175902 isoform X1 [Saccostrea echinata]|uniref:uncharacterized protein LOC133175902 isoform X1 n=1 Tax=Saccostrea echinata TaxID=191078 RepID=UPI002A811A00|nr:uncharacterized protein LOC133175902 isoform X1 [Saccostrea echinata]